ncbi:MAG: hypothetical protein ACFFE2_00825 [Candidatus Thorarchaeota archaeon]
MVRMPYDHRTRANFRYDSTKAGFPARHGSMKRLTEVLWYGEDDEGYCVYKRDPKKGDVVRIDFLPPVKN